MSSKPQVWLRLKTQSPSTLRWRLRGQASHICRFERTVKSGTQIGFMDGRRYRDCEGKQLLPSAWIDKVNHATIDMHLGYGLRYSNCFWALPEKNVYMAVGYSGQVIMVFPDLDVVAVTTGRASLSLNELAR
jgi:CubicO group peptidase (beta-lactamase class C family)